MTRKDRVIAHLREATSRQLSAESLDCSPFETEEIARSLQLDRTNVSKILNELWNDGEALKVQGRPILYLSLRVLNTAFPDSFFPSTLADVSELRRLLNSGTFPSAPRLSLQRDALPEAIRLPLSGALSACSYPPYGLPLLLTSPSQEDVHTLVQHLFDQLQKQRPEEAKLISIDCRGCVYGEKSFLRKVFGSSKDVSPDGRSAKSCFELSRYGLVHLEGIHRLPDSILEMLLTAVDRGSFCRIGEAVPRSLNTTLVCSLPAQSDPAILHRLQKHFPCRESILALDDRGLNEKLTLLVNLFSQEANAISHSLIVSKDALAYLLAAGYPAGISQLRTVVKQFCAASFTGERRQSSLELNCASLPQRILADAGARPCQVSYLMRLLSILPNDCMVFNPGSSQAIPASLRGLFLRTGSLDAMPEDEIFRPRSEQLLFPAQYIQDLLRFLAGRSDSQITHLQSWLPHYVFQQGCRIFCRREEEQPSGDPVLALGPLLLMQNRTLWKQHLPLPDKSNLPTPTPELTQVCGELYSLFDPEGCFPLTGEELTFFCAYLAAARRFAHPRITALLLVLHGSSVASQYAGMMKQQYPNLPAAGIDVAGTDTPASLRSRTVSVAESIHQGEGVLLITDMPVFLSLAEYITQQTGILCKAVSSLSFSEIMALAERCFQRASLSQLSDAAVSAESPEAVSHATPFMQRYFRESYTQDLRFLDPEKSFRILYHALNEILDELGLSFTHEITIKFLAHSSHMVERVISADAMNYPNLRRFLSKNSRVVSVIQKCMEPAANTFGITLPASEVAYLAEIFLQYL